MDATVENARIILLQSQMVSVFMLFLILDLSTEISNTDTKRALYQLIQQQQQQQQQQKLFKIYG